MGIWDRLLKTERRIRQRVENAFGHGADQTPLEVRRGILEQVESRIVVDSGGRVFPFGKVAVRLRPPTEALRSIFEASFLQNDSLRSDIFERLRDSKASYPREIEITVELTTGGSSDTYGGICELDFATVDREHKRKIPAIK